MNLRELSEGQKGVIIKVKGTGAFRRRVKEMGFVKGKVVKLVKKAPLADPLEFKLLDYEISLRCREAELIEIIPFDKVNEQLEMGAEFLGVIDEQKLKTTLNGGKTIDVALVGNPNCGKTTIFNNASGLREHVGNYGGVTVDAKVASYKLDGYSFNMVDLPGTYSLSAYSQEEIFVREYIIDKKPDIIINVIDASNLERNFYLTTQLIDMDMKVVIALNMYDELLDKKDEFDFRHLGEMIGIPIIPTVGAKGKGVTELFRKVIEVFENKDSSVRHVHINYGKGVEKSITSIREKLEVNKDLFNSISSRFAAIKLLEKDEHARKLLDNTSNKNDIEESVEKNIQRLESHLKEDTETLITDARYGFISGALRETYKPNKYARKLKTDTEVIDTFLTHRLFGFPIFIFFLWIMFLATFRLGQYPMAWIESLVGIIGDGVQYLLPDGMIKDLVIDGVIGGVGGVIVFLPNILILFFFISLMEDTGYMARAAFIMDRIMHKIGLHGKSFIPMIMGFGCNVPAIMATRTLRNRNERLLTMLINPFMSCSARLPVYILIISAFFPGNEVAALFSVYGIGIFFSVAFALLFKKTVFKSKETPFVMELPPYRLPTLRAVLRHMWHKGVLYLKKMGGIILIASLIIWVLEYFPKDQELTAVYQEKAKQLTEQYEQLIVDADQAVIDSLLTEKDAGLSMLRLEEAAKQQELSYIGRLGKAIEPVMAPLGFDWKMSVSVLAGVAAKEIVISTMGVLYQVDSEADDSSLVKKLQEARYEYGKKQGEKVFSPITAFAFLMFILIYFPCVAVIATIKKESGSWKWALFTAVYTTLTAWVVAMLVYQLGSLFF